MIYVSEILARVRRVTNDTSATPRTEDTELFGWIADCLNLILTVNPELFAKTTNFSLQPGVAQSVVGVTGAALFLGIAGYPESDLSALDAFKPGWRAGATGALQCWSRGDSGFLSFLVYPPSAGGQSVSLRYAKTATTPSTGSDVLDIPDNYIPPIVQYCVGMTEAKDDEHVNSNRSAQAKAEFLAVIKGA